MKRKKFWAALVTFAMLAGILAYLPDETSAAEGNVQTFGSGESVIQVYLGSRLLSFTVPPQAIDGSVMLPMRPVFEAFGATLQWNNDTQTATCVKGSTTVVTQIDNNVATINGVEKILAVPPTAIDGTTLAPLRFVAEAFGNSVEWDGDTQTVHISESVSPPSVSTASSTCGNTPGNSINGALACQSGDWIFYRNDFKGHNLYRIKTDGSEKQQIVGEWIGQINVLGDWIYYTTFNDKEERLLYKIKTDGSQQQKLCDDLLGRMVVSGDWIYYLNASDGFRIYKIKTDGSGRQKITSDTSGQICFDSDWLYYPNGEDGYKIYKIKTDGSGRQKLNDDESVCANAAGEWIYYCNISKGCQIYKIKTDGSGNEKLGDDKVDCVNVSGDWIYFRNESDGGKIYRMKTDGSGKICVSKAAGTFINIINDWIYFANHGDHDRLYRMKLDGSGQEMVE